MNNSDLYNALLLLTKEIFGCHLSKEIDDEINYPLKWVVDGVITDEVKQIAKFKTVESLIYKDEKICRLLNNLVGTSVVGYFNVGDAQFSIFQLIYRMFRECGSFNLEVFKKKYKEFEEFFYTDELRMSDSVRLYNFDSEVDIIVLASGLSIKKSPIDKRTGFSKDFIIKPNSDFIIERNYKGLKRIGSNEELPDQDDLEKINESSNIFDNVVKSLRLLKTSGVYREHIIETRILSYIPHLVKVSRFQPLENTVVGKCCKIAKLESNELKKIFTKITQSNSELFRIASDRLTFGLERKYEQDKIIDFMIGLESIYLPDCSDELSFRLSLRIAFLLEKKSLDRKNLYKFIKRVYKSRSSLVHGSKDTKNILSADDISLVEEVLRKSLRVFVFDPEKFSMDVNKDGILCEGNLENIFFK